MQLSLRDSQQNATSLLRPSRSKRLQARAYGRRMVLDIDWIVRGLEKPGKTQAGLALALGRDRSAVTRLLRGDRQLKADEITTIENYLEVANIRGIGGAAAQKERDSIVYNDPAPLAPTSYPRGKVYVMRPEASGRLMIDFSLIAQFDPKPAHYSTIRDMFGVIIDSDIMDPRFRIGEIAWVNPNRSPRLGEDVLFIDLAGGMSKTDVLIGVLKDIKANGWRAHTYLDCKEFDVSNSKFRALTICPRD